MTINLYTVGTGPFQLFSDAALINAISMGTLDSKLKLPYLERPPRRRINVFPRPGVDVDTTAYFDVSSNNAKTTDTDWSTSGSRAFKCSPTSTNTPSIAAASALVMSALPGRYYTLGLDVHNFAAVSKAFTLTLSIGSSTWNTIATVQAGATSRLIVPASLAPTSNALAAFSTLGNALASKLTWSLTANQTHTTSEPIGIDSVFLGIGSDASFSPDPRMPEGDLNRSDPVPLWIKNASATTALNARVQLESAGPDAPRPYIEASQDPDLYPWSSAAQAPVVVSSSLASGASSGFWIRSVIDENVPEGDHDLALVLSAN